MSNDDTKYTNMFKGFIMGWLRNWSAEDIAGLIQQNVPIIDLIDLSMIADIPIELRNGIKGVIERNKDKISQLLTVEKVIELSYEYGRPDLGEMISYPVVYTWMEKAVKIIKFVVENIELSPPQIKKKILDTIEEKKKLRRPIEIMPQPVEIQNVNEIIETVEPPKDKIELEEQIPIVNPKKTKKDTPPKGIYFY